MEEAWELAVVKIFASWSGQFSKEVAERFAEWLPKVVQGADVFVSPRIAAGDGWLDAIISALRESEYGVAFVTKDNMDSPWLQFESGALALKFEKARISPVLCDLDNTDLHSKNPLSNFQAVELNHDDFRKLIESIVRVAKYPTLSINDIDETLSLWGDKFFSEINSIKDKYALNQSELELQASEVVNGSSTENDFKEVISDLVGEVRGLSSRVDSLSSQKNSEYKVRPFDFGISPERLNASLFNKKIVFPDETEAGQLVKDIRNSQSLNELYQIEEMLAEGVFKLEGLDERFLKIELNAALKRLGEPS